jgi:diacylglycerol kinase (ATP)
MRATLVVNPASGRGAGARAADRVAAIMRAVVDRLDVHLATDAGDTLAAVRHAVDNGHDVLAVLGGDGTVHLALQPCAQSSTALAVIPAGTGNDLATCIGLPADPVAAATSVATAITTGRTRTLDLGRVRGGRWFATVLCAGFDSMVNERANRMRWPTGPRRYELAILAELARLRAYPLTIETDHGSQRLRATMVAIGNTASYGGGLRICRDAKLDDGLFDVTVIGPVTRRRLVRVSPKLREGGHIGEPEVTTMQARKVHLAGENGWVAYADGDPQCPLPISVECVPAAIRVVTASPTEM